MRYCFSMLDQDFFVDFEYEIISRGSPERGRNGPPEFYDMGSDPEWYVTDMKLYIDGPMAAAYPSELELPMWLRQVLQSDIENDYDTHSDILDEERDI